MVGAAAAFLLLAGALALAVAWPSFSRTPAALFICAAGVLWAATRLDQFMMFFVAFLFVEGFLKGVYPEPITFFLRDIFLGLIYLIWFIKYPVRRGFRGRYDRVISAAILAFVAYTLAVTLIPFSGESFFHRLGGARFWLANVPLFFVGADLFSDGRRFNRFVAVYLGAAAATAVYGIVQYFIGFEHLVRVSEYYEFTAGWSHWWGMETADSLRARVFSTFDLPPSFAAAMLVGCLFAVGYAVHKKRPTYKILFLILFSLCFSALTLTGTRAVYAPFLIAFAVYFILERKRTAVAAVLVIIALSVAFVYVVSQGVYVHRLTLLGTDYQYTLWRITTDFDKALWLVRDRPFGLGIATSAKLGRVFTESGTESTFRFIENGYGQSLVSLGWPGFALFTAMLLAVPLRTGWRAFRRSPGAWRTTLVFAFCFSMLFPMLTGMTLYAGLWPVIYWLAAGAVMAPGFDERGG